MTSLACTHSLSFPCLVLPCLVLPCRAADDIRMAYMPNVWVDAMRSAGEALAWMLEYCCVVAAVLTGSQLFGRARKLPTPERLR